MGAPIRKLSALEEEFVDPPGIEPGPPQCECGVLPIDYGP